MSAWFDIIVRPLLFAGLIALAFIPLEILAPLRPRGRTEWRTDVLYATAGAIATRAMLFVVAGAMLAFTEHAELRLGIVPPLADVPSWIAVPFGLLVFELGGYLYHRLAHRVPLLWRLHAVHHSSTELDWLAGFRQHPLEIVLMTICQNLPLVVLGLPLGDQAMVVLLLKINTIFVHANVRTPAWLTPWIATPRFHHRHHDPDGNHTNFATLFPWIDRLFRTHA